MPRCRRCSWPGPGHAALPEQGGLLIARDPRNGQRIPQEIRVGFPANAARPHDGGEQRVGYLKEAGELAVPAARRQSVQHGPRGIGRVGDVGASPGQPRDEPAIHRARGQLAPLRPEPELGVVEQPFQLGRGEVRIQQESAALPDQRLGPRGPELHATLRGPPVLPDDRRRHGLERLPLPEDQRLALIGDADTDGALPGLRQGVPCRRQRGADQLLRIVLDPAGRGKVLAKLPLPTPQDRAVLVHHEGAGAGSALVQGEERRHGQTLHPPDLPGKA